MSTESFSPEDAKKMVDDLRTNFEFKETPVELKNAEAILKETLDEEETKKLEAEFENSIFKDKKEFAKLGINALMTDDRINGIADLDNRRRLNKKREKARAELEDAGIDVKFMVGEGLLEDEARKRMTEFRKVMLNIRDDKDDAKRSEALKKVGVPDEVIENWKTETVAIPVAEPVAPTPVAPERTENKKGNEKFRIRTEAHLDSYLEAISRSGLTDYRSVTQRLRREADSLLSDYVAATGDPVKQAEILALQNRINEKAKEFETKNISSEIKSVKEVDVPKEDNDSKGWRRWARSRMSNLIDPQLLEDGSRRGGQIFQVTVENINGKINKDGLLFAPAEVQEEMNGRALPEGGTEKGEIDIAEKMGRMFKDWRTVHGDIKKLANAFEDNSNYALPDSSVNGFLLNKLKGEDGSEDGGSKNISKAVQIYWAMANRVPGNGSERILADCGLSDIGSLFNQELPEADLKEIRKRVAVACGGSYYENYGLMYASFLGIAAKGSNDKTSKYSDVMGKLIHQGKVNDYADEAEKNSPKRRAWLPDTVARRFNIKNANGEDDLVSGSKVPVEIGAHPGNFQEKWGDKNFFVVNGEGGKFLIKEDKPDGYTGREYAFEEIVKQGRLHEIDWEKSDDLFAMMKAREGKAVGVYNMFTKLDDTLEKISDEKVILSAKEKIKKALIQYNPETRTAVGYLWLVALIDKNLKAWTAEDKKEILRRSVKMTKEQGLISDVELAKLENRYGLSFGSQLNKSNTWKTSSFYRAWKNIKGG